MLNGFSNRMPHNNEGVAKNLFSKFKQTLQDRLKWWSSVNNNDNSSTTSTLDWRSLSPDKPPLPFFLPNDSNYSPSSSTSDLFHQTTLIPITDIIEVNQKYTKTRSTEDQNNFQPLCPIMEESETITTDTNSSIVARSIQQNEGASNDRIINNQSYAVAEKPNADSNTSDTTTFSAPSSRSVASSAVSFHPPPSAPQTPVHAPLNEKECKRKFVKFVLAANKYRQRKGTKKPTRMSLIFDANDDVETMCVIRQGKAEYHKFNGISQYIPPELYVDSEYHYRMVDVWVLGVHLYKMLLGHYPFAGTNDKQQFNNMIQRNLVFPDELSKEAKDILKRMLAPDTTRASLDLVIHHPWLRSYHKYLVKNCHFESTPQKAYRKTFSIKTLLLVLTQGPFPPPRKPYRDLVHLGTRESVFFSQF